MTIIEIPCPSSVDRLSQTVDFTSNLNVIHLYSDLNTTSYYAKDIKGTVPYQLAYSPSSLLSSVGFEDGFIKSLTGSTIIFFKAESLNQSDEFMATIQSVYAQLYELKEYWLPTFVVLLNTSLDKEIPPEMKENWGRRFRADSQVYFLVLDTCGNGFLRLASTVEIYSITNASIVLRRENENWEDFSAYSYVTTLITTRTQRRLNFHRALIVGINVDAPGYEASTKYMPDDGTNEVEFESGFEVLEYWYLRDALNFTDKAAKWPAYLRQAPNGSVTGLGVAINYEFADICIGYTEFLEYRVAAPNGITFLHPTFYNEIQVFFTQPAASSIRDIFLNAFTKDIWLAVATTWILMVFLIIAFVRIKQRMARSSIDPLDFRMYDAAWFWAAGAICQKSFYSSPSSTCVRITFLVGIVAGMILYTAYSAALVAILSVEVVPVKLFKDLLENKFEIFGDSHIPTAFAVVQDLEDSGIIKKLDASRIVEIEKIVPDLVKSKIAIVSFTDSFYQVALYVNDYQPDFICKKVSTVLFRRRPGVGSMFVKRGSPLREYFNCKIALMKERGILFRLRSHYIQTTSVSCLQSLGGLTDQLAPKDLFTAYIILGVGVILSFLILFLERMKEVYCVRLNEDEWFNE